MSNSTVNCPHGIPINLTCGPCEEEMFRVPPAAQQPQADILQTLAERGGRLVAWATIPALAFWAALAWLVVSMVPHG